MNRNGMRYLVAGSLLTVFFGWMFKVIDDYPALASDTVNVSTASERNGPKSGGKAIVATQLKLVDHKGEVTAILGTHSNGEPYLKMFGDSKNSFSMIESDRVTIVVSGSEAIVIHATDGDRRIDVLHSKNHPTFSFHSDNDGSCSLYLRNNKSSSIGFSCEADGAVIGGLSTSKLEGGITFAVSPNGSPVVGLSRNSDKGALSLYCYESAPGITVTSSDGKLHAVVGSRGDTKEDAKATLFRICDTSNRVLWKAP